MATPSLRLLLAFCDHRAQALRGSRPRRARLRLSPAAETLEVRSCPSALAPSLGTDHRALAAVISDHAGQRERRVELLLDHGVRIASPLKKAAAAGSKTIYVKPAGKSNSHSLTTTIQHAKPGTTIVLAPGVYTQNIVLMKKSNITIVGAPDFSSIIAPAKGNAINIQLSTNITVQNVWLRAEGSGGNGLIVLGSTVNAQNIKTDLTQSNGFVMKSDKGRNSTLTANSCQFDGVQSLWGGWVGSGTTSTITDSSFNNNGNGPNPASNSNGFVVTGNAQVTIVNSQFNGNYGNGLVVLNNPVVTLQQDTFASNTHGNGALFLDQPTVNLVGNTFESNGLIVNYALGFNGVEFNSSFTGTATVSGNTFNDNTAFGLYVGGASNIIQIDNNTFADNPTGISLDGGAASVNVSITGNTFSLPAVTSNNYQGVVGDGSDVTATIGGAGTLANVFENFADMRSIQEFNQVGSPPQTVGYPNFNILVNSFLQNGQTISPSEAIQYG